MKCNYKPEELINIPMGMFHCPECGEMVLTGAAHPDYELLEKGAAMAPCGGITNSVLGMYEPKGGPCFTCGEQVTEHGLFVEEWDAIIHRDCLGEFLCSEEGKVVMAHKHQIIVPEL